MTIQDVLERLLNWNTRWIGDGPDCDIVISSRIRLARNIAGFPFPHRATEKQAKAVRDMVYDVMSKIDICGEKAFINMEELDELDKQFLVERHLVSFEHTVKGNSKGLVLRMDETFSIMVNEEDHIRMQIMMPGLDLSNIWLEMNSLDDAISENLKYAYSRKMGYLTSCPTNTGTGLRGSVMLHLPALVLSKQINNVLQTLSKLNFTARGLYGEGTQAQGNFFQISNQFSLGSMEQEMLDAINRVIKQVVEQEKFAREKIFKTSRIMIEDKIYRAYGIAINARIMNSKDAFEILSMVRLGYDMGILTSVSRELMNKLFIIIQPAHLQKLNKRRLSARQRDIKRATAIRQMLTDYVQGFTRELKDISQEE